MGCDVKLFDVISHHTIILHYRFSNRYCRQPSTICAFNSVSKKNFKSNFMQALFIKLKPNPRPGKMGNARIIDVKNTNLLFYLPLNHSLNFISFDQINGAVSHIPGLLLSIIFFGSYCV